MLFVTAFISTIIGYTINIGLLELLLAAFMLLILTLLILLVRAGMRKAHHSDKQPKNAASPDIAAHTGLTKTSNEAEDTVRAVKKRAGTQDRKALKFFSASWFMLHIAVLFVVLLIVFVLKNRNGSSAFREQAVFSHQGTYVFGLDVSHYQGKIDWKEVQKSKHPIEFVLIRATMGKDGQDRHYTRNYRRAKKNDIIVGAYHYYRPNENSTQQFENFKTHVKLKPGDLPPVLDIERHSKHGIGNLRAGILNWLKLAEEHYGVKPILYTGHGFYRHNLRGHVDDYLLWISGFHSKKRLGSIRWTFHQFTDKVRVRGIKSHVDGNDFKGSLEELKAICIPENTE